jgi:DUF4097 and DUF4098 domain-containing protein YvlB
LPLRRHLTVVNIEIINRVQKELQMRKIMSLAAITLLTAAAASAGAYTETFDQTYPVDHGAQVGLENINGDVTIEVWDHPEVRVYAVKSASSPERLAALKIDVDASSSSVFVDTHYPSSRDLSFDDRHGHSEVEYTLTVPRFATIDGVELVNGDLLIDGVEGSVEADTVNGTIVVRGASGEIELETVNGGIELELGSGVSDEISLGSVNGTIEVFLIGSAEVRAETVNGRIRNDFGLEVKKGKYVGSTMRGSIGAGGPVIEMETVNGGIRVSSR